MPLKLLPHPDSRNYEAYCLLAYGISGVVAGSMFGACMAGADHFAQSVPILLPLGFLVASMVLLGFAIYFGHAHKNKELARMGAITAAIAVVVPVFVVGGTLKHGGNDPAGLLIGLLISIPVLFAVLALVGEGSVRLALRIKLEPVMGICPTCGYSLKGLVSAMCPECGADCAGLLLPADPDAETPNNAGPSSPFET